MTSLHETAVGNLSTGTIDGRYLAAAVALCAALYATLQSIDFSETVNNDGIGVNIENGKDASGTYDSFDNLELQEEFNGDCPGSEDRIHYFDEVHDGFDPASGRHSAALLCKNCPLELRYYI